MTSRVNCKDAGDPICSHTMFDEPEEGILQNVKKHGIRIQGYIKESWNQEITKNIEHFHKLIQAS